MPPKGSRVLDRGRRRIPNNGIDNSKEEEHDIISIGDVSDSSSIVITGRRMVPTKGKTVTRGARAPRGGRSVVGFRTHDSDIYGDLLQEALGSSPAAEGSERPRKRRRVRNPGASDAGKSRTTNDNTSVADRDEDEPVFEDVLSGHTPQVAYRDSDEDSEDGDHEWEELAFEKTNNGDEDDDESQGNLDITLNDVSVPQQPTITRRRTITKADRSLRLEIHKMHILCLMSAIFRRNQWCNDETIQSILLPMVDKKILANLRPPPGLSQFRQTDLLKAGLSALIPIWNARYSVIARGMRKAFWVEDEQSLSSYKLPPDAEASMRKVDFLAAARSLKSSRDIGAMLFCSLLRGTGLEVRLICSLQSLPFAGTVGTNMAASGVSSPLQHKSPSPEDHLGEAIDVNDHNSPFSSSNASTSNVPFSARRRLGHPLAAEYHIPTMASAIPSVSMPKPKKPKHIHESPFPVFWVEVLDEAHQRWIAVDPIVTRTVGKAQRLEPPATDALNNMAYVLAFEDDGVIRDVTRRYTKAYNSKTRKVRVESTERGDKWWKKTMEAVSRDWSRDLDQIEDNELATIEAREPMPKNIIDFKDHPIYALERHLRQNEVLVHRHEVGKVPAGKNKGMESVYRRNDVKLARSADRWYRLGRDVKVGEQPIKIVPSKKRDIETIEDDGERVDAGTGLYIESQTEVYIPPPIINGRVPRNTYGNLDIYVPSMVPAGGCHIPFEEAKRAALLIQVDYAEAVTGFKFQGRRGTPIVNGVIVATEYREAILALIEGFRDERRKAEDEMKSLVALRMWKSFLVGLRIKERVDGYKVEGEMADHEERHSTVFADDSQAGGFVPEGTDNRGGFFPDHGHHDGDTYFHTHEESPELGGGFFPEVHADDIVDYGDSNPDTRPRNNLEETASEADFSKSRMEGRDSLTQEDEEGIEVTNDNDGMTSEEYEMEDDGEGGGFLLE